VAALVERLSRTSDQLAGMFLFSVRTCTPPLNHPRELIASVWVQVQCNHTDISRNTAALTRIEASQRDAVDHVCRVQTQSDAQWARV
jgi:hypothetical protein